MPITFKFIPPSSARTKRVFQDLQDPIADAATRAIEVIGEDLKRSARASIAAAGFSTKWQNALRINKYPRGTKTSINAAVWLFHKISYANVFEEGATIRGRPYLWIPVSSAKNLLGRGRRLSVEEYKRRIGSLRFVKRPGSPPMLMGQVASRGRGAITASRLRRGAGRGGKGVKYVPIFVGVPVVRISRRFRIREAVVAAYAKLPGVFARFIRSAR